jgi:hypothetical protein
MCIRGTSLKRSRVIQILSHRFLACSLQRIMGWHPASSALDPIASWKAGLFIPQVNPTISWIMMYDILIKTRYNYVSFEGLALYG